MKRWLCAGALILGLCWVTGQLWSQRSDSPETLATATDDTDKPSAKSKPSKRTVRVGPDRKYTRPSQAASAVKDGTVVEIDAGVYTGDVAVWRQNDLTLRGVGGLAHLKADGAAADGKAIWVIKGSNTRVENIEFSGARVRDKNGAGIRQEGPGLTVVGCSFHDNQNGILVGRNPESEIVIERSEFARNGHGDGQSHNMYISKVRSFTLRHSYVHHAKIGHNVKSRALTSYILYNRIMDEESGSSSFAVDLPNGGRAFVIGNLFQQGPFADNWSMLNYASDRKREGYEEQLCVVNNTFVNTHDSGVFVKNKGTKPARLINNIFAGRGTVLSGPGDLAGNLAARSFGLKDRVAHLVTGDTKVFAGPDDDGANVVSADARFVDAGSYDYRLLADSPAIDAGVDPGVVEGYSLAPSSQYLHPSNGKSRQPVGAIDVGAYEFPRD